MAPVHASEPHVHFLLPDPPFVVGEPFEPVAPGEPTLPFAEWIHVQASAIRFNGRDSSAALWLAAKVDEIAAFAKRVGACCPNEFDVCEMEAEADHADRLKAAGYDSACNGSPHALLY
jgi:hypothetical protein